MTWQIAVAFILGFIIGGAVIGFVAYKKGRKDEYGRWRHVRMTRPGY